MKSNSSKQPMTGALSAKQQMSIREPGKIKQIPDKVTRTAVPKSSLCRNMPD